MAENRDEKTAEPSRGAQKPAAPEAPPRRMMPPPPPPPGAPKGKPGAAPAPGAGAKRPGAEPPDPTRYGDWEKNGRCIDF